MTIRLSLLASLALLAACATPRPPVEAPAAEAPATEPPATEATAHHEAMGDMGEVDFPVSCDPAVQDGFDEAMTHLHHMMYEQARGAFESVAAQDPGCAMARWGVAMTLFQPLWPSRPSVEDLRRGLAEVQAARAIGGMTPREQAFVDAVAGFYEEPETADWRTRILRFEQGMEQVYRAWPQDPEAATLYALAHLAAGSMADDQAAYHERAAAILLDVHREHERHPGAVHYLTHANDTDQRAERELEVIQGYSEMAPDVPHALHMPSHIYVRLGAWDDVIAWNRESADAALQHPVGELASHHHPHAMDYMLYAYLQQGRDDLAEAAVAEVQQRAEQPGYQPSFISAYHLAAMPARYAVEREDWARAATLTPRTPADLDWDKFPMPEAITWYARGLGAVATGELADAAAALERMDQLTARAEEMGEKGWAALITIDRLVLAGRLAHARGDADEAIALMQQAAALEARTEKPPVSPGALLPPNEALGALYLELDRPAEALAAYQASLERWPRRFRGLLGAARAARLAGEDRLAETLYTQLLEVASAESAREEPLAEARRYLQSRQRLEL